MRNSSLNDKRANNFPENRYGRHHCCSKGLSSSSARQGMNKIKKTINRRKLQPGLRVSKIVARVRYFHGDLHGRRYYYYNICHGRMINSPNIYNTYTYIHAIEPGVASSDPACSYKQNGSSDGNMDLKVYYTHVGTYLLLFLL